MVGLRELVALAFDAYVCFDLLVDLALVPTGFTNETTVFSFYFVFELFLPCRYFERERH